MSAKHTPGPWRVDIDRAIVADSQARGIWRTVVADLGLPTSPNGAQEREANAHLIAAAPDLLEALEELVVTADNMRAWIERQAAATPEDHAAIARARAAIAKAKGESA